jgi:CRISPR/Cas system CMR subunit Cmr6 (Cas7 group RAMP superfamily)
MTTVKGLILVIGFGLSVTMASAAVAADTSSSARDDDLQKQIIQLRKELDALKSIIQREADGTLRVVSDMQVERGVASPSLQDNGGSLSINSRRDLTMTAAKKLVINSGDELTLQSGQSSITMKKNGNIIISGTVLDIRGSSDIIVKSPTNATLKGSKINQN